MALGSFLWGCSLSVNWPWAYWWELARSVEGEAVFGLYGFGQIGWATYLWTQQVTDMEAVSMLYTIKMTIMQEGGITLER